MLRGCLLLVAVVAAAGYECHMDPNAYPPPKNDTLVWYTLDLAKPPKDRWTDIVKGKGPQITALVDQEIKLLGKDIDKYIKKLLDDGGQKIIARMTQEYGEEIQGIADATGVPLGYVAAMNLAYEITGVGCTSIVAQDKNGDVFHARNLDFGLFSGFDFKNDTWYLTEMLRGMLFNLRVVNGEKFLYNSTTFYGYVGLLSGASEAFGLTVDSRFDANLDYYLIEWLEGRWNGLELTQLTRLAMENNKTYADGVDFMQKTNIVGPAYMIVSGPNPGEGAVIARSANKDVNTWTLQEQLTAGSFYVLETNYDHWKRPPIFDDRRDPAEKCLNQTGAAQVDKTKLYDILSGRPNLNALTTYTTFFHVKTQTYEAYAQRCVPPCTPW